MTECFTSLLNNKFINHLFYVEIKEKYPDGVLPSNLSPLHNRLVNSIAAKKNVNGDMDDEVYLIIL